MKPSRLVLRCYAESDADGSWFAMCLDLNLYARGDSFKEVKHKLHRFIADYVKEAVTEDAEYIDHLVPRPAPLSFWLRYACIFCMAKLHHAAKSRKFKLLLPMVPAAI